MTRVVAGLLLLSLVSLGGAAVGMAAGIGTRPCGEPRMAVDSPADRFEATFVGDTMLGDAALPQLAASGYDWVFDGVRALVGDGFVMANAEAPITTLSTPFDPAQHWHYNAQPAAAPAMARAGIDAVSLANNHAMDRGPQGLADTLAALDDAGIAAVGAGMRLCEAELPLLVDTPAGTLGIVALGKYYGRDKMASVAGAGTVALSKAAIVRGAALARSAGADQVIAFVHWGRSYDDVTREQEEFAQLFVDAGYAMVIGAHPHVSQRIEVLDGVPIVHSLGNFVFGAPGRFTEERPGTGLILRVTFRPDGIESLIARCIVTDNDLVGFRPGRCDAATAASVLGALNPDMQVAGDTGQLVIP